MVQRSTPRAESRQLCARKARILGVDQIDAAGGAKVNEEVRVTWGRNDRTDVWLAIERGIR